MLFGVTPLTVIKWRNNKGLPFMKLPGDGRPAIRFSAKRTAAWAKRAGYKMLKGPNSRVNGRKREVVECKT